MHWEIRKKEIDPEKFKEDFLDLLSKVNVEQDDINPVTTLRIYIPEEGNKNLSLKTINDNIPILEKRGYKVTKIE